MTPLVKLNEIALPTEQLQLGTQKQEGIMSLKRPAVGGESCGAGFFLSVKKHMAYINRSRPTTFPRIWTSVA